MLSLKRLLLSRSQCQLPLSSIPPLTVPLIQAQCSRSPPLGTSHLGKLDILFPTLFTGTHCPCAFFNTLLSHAAISHLLMALFPSCFPKFSIACSTIMRSLTKEVHEAERDVMERAGGCAEAIVPLLTSLPACLPGPEEHPHGAAC